MREISHSSSLHLYVHWNTHCIVLPRFISILRPNPRQFGAWFRHVDTLCFALESRRWRDDTSRVVQALVTGAGDTVKILGNVLESSEDLRLKNAAALDEALKASALSATLVEQVGTMQVCTATGKHARRPHPGLMSEDGATHRMSTLSSAPRQDHDTSTH